MFLYPGIVCTKVVGKPSCKSKVNDIILGLWGTSKSKERYSRFVAQLATNPTPLPLSTALSEQNLTVLKLCAAYLEFAQGYYVKDGCLSNHISTVKRALSAIKELYGSIPADQFGPLAYRAIQNNLVARNLSRSTINGTCRAIRRMFKWAVSQKMVPLTVYQALATVPGLKKGRT